MSLVKYREYDIETGGDDLKQFQVNIPIDWLREHSKAGDKLGLFIDSDTLQLVVSVIPQNNKVKTSTR